jgi:hypothetical protein
MGAPSGNQEQNAPDDRSIFMNAQNQKTIIFRYKQLILQ